MYILYLCIEENLYEDKIYKFAASSKKNAEPP